MVAPAYSEQVAAAAESIGERAQRSPVADHVDVSALAAVDRGMAPLPLVWTELTQDVVAAA